MLFKRYSSSSDAFSFRSTSDSHLLDIESSGNLQVAGDLQVKGNDIMDSAGAIRIKMITNGNLEIRNYNNEAVFEAGSSTAKISKPLTAGTVNSGALDASGKITAKQGITVPSGQTINLGGVSRSTWPQSGAWSTSGGNVYRSSGRVGVGTSSPAYDLDVSGNQRTTGKIYSGSLDVSGQARASDLVLDGGTYVKIYTKSGACNSGDYAMATYTSGRTCSGSTDTGTDDRGTDWSCTGTSCTIPSGWSLGTCTYQNGIIDKFVDGAGNDAWYCKYSPTITCTAPISKTVCVAS